MLEFALDNKVYVEVQEHADKVIREKDFLIEEQQAEIKSLRLRNGSVNNVG